MGYPLEDVGERRIRGLQVEHEIALRFRMKDFGVILPPTHLRAKTESREPFEFEIDLEVYLDGVNGLTDPSKRRVIEVKGKSGAKDVFTTVDTWPHENVALYNVNKKTPPYAVVLYSTHTKHALVVVAGDSPWSKHSIHDKKRNATYDVWTAENSALMTFDYFLDRLRRELADQIPPQRIIEAPPVSRYVPQELSPEDEEALLTI
jgi:hypothetical protein